ncbi:MAG: hypothetical protein H0U53_03440 [Actinobacteria bacterium]|nr:hypothetical protein [Actinomycetota bacterium]
MSDFEFELVATGVLDDAAIDALFEAGCGDATFGARDGVVTALFSREATDLTAAVMSAIAAVEGVLGRGAVMRVEPGRVVKDAGGDQLELEVTHKDTPFAGWVQRSTKARS